jgi:hypothetical protein
MKKILYLLCFLPLMVHAQVKNDTIALSAGVQDSVLGTSIVLKDRAIIFQKVYQSNLKKDELLKQLKDFLPTVKSFELSGITNQTEDRLTGKLADFLVNYRKFGGTKEYVQDILDIPIFANVIIQVKDYRYKVLISQIVFKTISKEAYTSNIPFDEIVSRNDRQRIRTGTGYRETARFVNDDFSESFDLTSGLKLKADF